MLPERIPFVKDFVQGRGGDKQKTQTPQGKPWSVCVLAEARDRASFSMQELVTSEGTAAEH